MSTLTSCLAWTVLRLQLTCMHECVIRPCACMRALHGSYHPIFSTIYTALPTCHLRCMSNNLIFLLYITKYSTHPLPLAHIYITSHLTGISVWTDSECMQLEWWPCLFCPCPCLSDGLCGATAVGNCTIVALCNISATNSSASLTGLHAAAIYLVRAGNCAGLPTCMVWLHCLGLVAVVLFILCWIF
jgi:hypothetical protein